MTEDRELLSAWRGGDVAAGNRLLERYFQRLYRFFCNKLDEGIDDLIQRTFLACVERRDDLRDDGSFPAYLFRVARNELYDHYKRTAKERQILDGDVSSVHDFDPSPSRIMVGREEHKLLLDALRRIPLDMQIALELHYWEHMSSPELARVLDIPTGTVKSRLRRGKELLRERIADIVEGGEVLHSTLTRLDEWAEELKKWTEPPGE